MTLIEEVGFHLTPKQRGFVEYYIETGSAPGAADGSESGEKEPLQKGVVKPPNMPLCAENSYRYSV